MLRSFTYLSADGGDLPLAHQIESHHIGQTSTFHVLHDDPQIALAQIAVHEVHDVLVLAVFHDQNFIDDEIFLWLLLKVHLFDSHAFVGSDFGRGVDASGCPLADLVQAFVLLHRVARATDGVEPCDNVDAGVTVPPWSRRRPGTRLMLCQMRSVLGIWRLLWGYRRDLRLWGLTLASSPFRLFLMG